MSMEKLPVYIGFWLVNIAVFYLASLMTSGSVVIGNANVSPLAAALLCGFILTLAVSLNQPIARILGINVKKEEYWAVIFWGINSLTIWIIARFGIYTGLGISGFWWAIILGFLTTMLEWGIWKVSTAKKP